jgi:hypothetical protein
MDLMAERPTLVAELQGLGEALRKSRLAAEPTLPDDLLDRLRALGYVEGDQSSER